RDRHPDVRDDAGTGHFCDRDGLARLDVQAIVVATGDVEAREAPRLDVPQCGEAAQGGEAEVVHPVLLGEARGRPGPATYERTCGVVRGRALPTSPASGDPIRPSTRRPSSSNPVPSTR